MGPEIVTADVYKADCLTKACSKGRLGVCSGDVIKLWAIGLLQQLDVLCLKCIEMLHVLILDGACGTCPREEVDIRPLQPDMLLVLFVCPLIDVEA